MTRAHWILALAVACGDDPHANFVTPPRTIDDGPVWGAGGSSDNLVLNPDFTYPRFVNSLGVGSATWDVVHDVDTPTGQPALQGHSATSLLFRMVQRPMTAEVWVSGSPDDALSTEVVVVFTDAGALIDQQVELVAEEARVIGEQPWNLFRGEVPAGDGLGLLVISPAGDPPARVSAPVVRPDEAAEGLRSAGPPVRPADERWCALYRAHRPDHVVRSPGGASPSEHRSTRVPAEHRSGARPAWGQEP